MGLNVGEIIMIVAIVIAIFGLGRMGEIGEFVGRLVKGNKSGKGEDNNQPIAVGANGPSSTSEPLKPSDITGPEEDAELVDGS